MKSIKADYIYTGRKCIKNAFINFDAKTIESVSEINTGEIIDECHVITPAFIDPHSHIGMCRAGEPGDEDEANEQQESMTILADPLDSIQMDDKSFQDSIEKGILYSCVLPGSGNIIGGRSAVIRNYAKNTNAAFIKRAGIKAAFGYNPMSTRDWKGTRAYTRMGCIALLRAEFYKVIHKIKPNGRASKKAESELDAKQRLLKDILDRKIVLRVHVHKSDDIAALLRIVDEFYIKVSVEHACDVHDVETFAELAKRNIPVIYGPTDSFAYKTELKHETWRNVKYLIESKVNFTLMTDHPVVIQSNLIYMLRHFIRFGLSKSDAIGIISRKSAELLNLHHLGVLYSQKWASFICWNGDPFDMCSYPIAVYAEGKLIFSDQ